VPQTILPNPNPYSFGKTVLLVGPGCSSSCELEAYAFSQLPGMIVVGQYPSAGVLADVTRGQFLLPEGFSLQVPTGRFILPNGGIFLEGQGVPLTVRVPVDATTVLSAEDVVLNAAEKIVVGQ
jgi:C-terminal processing protease CtpA/Prc